MLLRKPGQSLNPRFVAWPLELGLGTLNPRFVVWPLELGLGTHNPRFVAWPLELGLGTLNPRFVAWPLGLGLGTHNPRFVAWPLELGLGTHNPRFVAWPIGCIGGILCDVLFNPKYAGCIYKVTVPIDSLGNIVWICPLAPGTSADVLIWDRKGPERVTGHYMDYEIGSMDGAYKGRLHVWLFIGRKTLTERQKEYNDVHGFYRARIEHLFVHMWHWGIVRNIWRESGTDLHEYVRVLLHL